MEAVASLMEDTLRLAIFVRNEGHALYGAEDEWKKLPEKVERLQGKSKDWDSHAANLGSNWCEQQVKADLQKAQVLLKTVEQKLEEQKAWKTQKEQKGKKLWEKLARNKNLNKGSDVFPKDIGVSINEVIMAFDAMALKEQQQARTDARSRPGFLDVVEHKGYFQLHDTEQALRRSLTHSNGSNRKLVLLHGKPGQGKSTLARNVAFQIQSSNEQSTEIQSVSGDSSQRSVPPIASDASSSAGPPHRRVSPIASNPISPTPDDYLVRGMLAPTMTAPNVNILVTSLDPHLCNGVTPTLWEGIPVEQVNLDDARKILVNHIYVPESGDGSITPAIPDDIKECADKIIEMVGRNPFAVACVGAARFNDADFRNLSKWEAIRNEMHDCLARERLAPSQNNSCPPSYRAAIHFLFTRLEDDERRLLGLIVLCRQLSVPRPIIQYLYNVSKGETNCQAFWDAKRTLEARHLVQTSEERCVIHPLLRSFLTNKFSHEYKDTILGAMFRNTNRMGWSYGDNIVLQEGDVVAYGEKVVIFEWHVVAAMSSLYFEDLDYVKRILETLKSGNLICRVEKGYFVDMAPLIEHVSLMALRESGGDWTSQLRLYSRKVTTLWAQYWKKTAFSLICT